MSIFSIGLSGLQAASSDLETISKNIANSSTAGYKSETTQFTSTYSGTESSGVTVAGTTQSFDVDGDMVETGDELDLAISGSGFFVLSSGDGTYAYSRDGDFSLDSEYNVIATNGMNVEGYTVDSTGNINYGTITDLSVTQTTIAAEASTSIDVTANLNSDATTIDTTSSTYSFDATDGTTYNYSISTEVYDSLGSSHTITQYYVKTDDNSWSVYSTLDGDLISTTPDTLTFDEDGDLETVNGVAAYTLDSNSDKVYDSTVAQLSFSGVSISSGADDLNLTVSLVTEASDGSLSSAILQYSNDFSSSSSADGNTSGTISEVYFDSDGYLWATYDNGETVLQGQIVLASFSNPDGLQGGSGTVWYETSDSGTPTYGTANAGSIGSLTVGYYENSNVDISSELVDLMSSQQSYQANAKALTAADEMASVLFNLG